MGVWVCGWWRVAYASRYDWIDIVVVDVVIDIDAIFIQIIYNIIVINQIAVVAIVNVIDVIHNITIDIAYIISARIS